MKIVPLVVALPFVVLGLFLLGQGAGLFSRAAQCCTDRRRRRPRSLGYRPCLVRIAVGGPDHALGK